MTKILDELKAKRAQQLEMLNQQMGNLRRLEKQWEDDDRIVRAIISDYAAELADLDKAISALLDPVPQVSDQSSSQESETNAPEVNDPQNAEVEPAEPQNAELDFAEPAIIAPAIIAGAEPLDAEPEAQILREHVPLDAPVIEDATGEQFAILQGEPVQIVSEAPSEPAGEQEPIPAAYEPLNQEPAPAAKPDSPEPIFHPEARAWGIGLGLFGVKAKADA